MEEVYEQLRKHPPVDPRSMDKGLEPIDFQFIEETVRDVFAPTESDSWWEENRKELSMIAEYSEPDFITGAGETKRSGKESLWAMQHYFGQEAWELKPSMGDSNLFSLTEYKGGAATALEKRRLDGAFIGKLFARTPFAQYWDSLPDLGVTRRVYAFNAVDHMAALKYMMNCTYNGMHGSEGNRQVKHS